MSQGSVSDEELAKAALEARSFAYSPYSSFPVGAALLTESGSIVTGCNVENAAYSPGNCAERTAIFKAVSEGQRAFRAIAIASNLDEPCSPCGVCRQVLREFCNDEFRIIMPSSSFPAKPLVVKTLADLLPMSFGPDQLGKYA